MCPKSHSEWSIVSKGQESALRVVVLSTGHPYFLSPSISIPLTLNSLQKWIDGPSPVVEMREEAGGSRGLEVVVP